MTGVEFVYSLDETLAIDTPENIILEAEIAGFGSRCLAALIDYTIILGLLFVLYAFTLSAVIGSRGSSTAVVIYIIIQFVIFLGYHLIFEWAWNGQTLGKRWLGIRVVQTNGLPITVTAVLIRNILRLIDFLPLGYGVGLISLFVTRRTQRLGDLAARTVVIRERKQVTLATIQQETRVQYIYLRAVDSLPGYVDISNLTAADRQRVIGYLNRRVDIVSRDSTAVLLARGLARQMPEPDVEGRVTRSGREAEIFLEQVARAFEVVDKTTPDTY
jgi:uncharacterized RDD family membrane protein YckC